MPLFYQKHIDECTCLAVWKINEDEAFFQKSVSLQRHISHPHKRLQHLAGRYLLRYLFPDFPIGLIEIADTRKPFLPNEAYHFSISHCGGFAAALVSSRHRVGIDIEQPTPKVERIRHKFLHPDELLWATESIKAMGKANNNSEEGWGDEQQRLLTLLWSCKEAVFKWWSYGEVDFSEMIRLHSFVLQPEGEVQGQFIEKQTQPLTLRYQLFDGLCLAWVVQQ